MAADSKGGNAGARGSRSFPRSGAFWGLCNNGVLMKSTVVCRRLVPWVIGPGVLAVMMMVGTARAALEVTNPATVVPLDQIAPEHRASVAEVISEHTFHRKGATETFPCNPRIYLSLLNEPALTLALWQDLAATPVRLRQVGPNRYEGTDGAGASAVWDFVYRSPKLHVLLADLDYTTPHGAAHFEARIVLVVHSGFYREVNGEHWIQHDVEAFVKVDSKGWKAVARTVRPIIERLLEDQVREAGWFVSLMGRLVAAYPNWACQVAMSQTAIAADTRQQFRDLVIQTRRPGAFSGRPTLADNVSPTPNTRTR
jgi:hypothetical protein